MEKNVEISWGESRLFVEVANYNQISQKIFGPGPAKIIGRGYNFISNGRFDLDLESETVDVPGHVKGQVEP